jgi:hypothetical protein
MDNFRHVIRATCAATTMAGAALALPACATDAIRDPSAAKVRADLSELQSDPNLASRAPVSIHDAETAVQDAERPQNDRDLAAHLVYLADRRVQIAKAQAQTKFPEDRRKALSDQSAGSGSPRAPMKRIWPRARTARCRHRATQPRQPPNR